MKSSATRPSRRPAIRAGGQALTLLSAPLNVEVLRTLAQGPAPLQDLRRDVGIPPQSTMRFYLRTLSEIGAVRGRIRSEFPTSVDYEIRPAGRALLSVGDAVQTWLQGAPGGPKMLGSAGAKGAIKVLVEGWASNIVRALATRPLSLTELNSLIPGISYPSLERRLTAMRQWNLVEPQRRDGRLTPYGVTGWLRHSVTPMIAAMAWEHTYAATKANRVRRLDVGTSLLLAIPLMHLPPDVNGKCRLVVEAQTGASAVFIGVVASIESGEVISCTPSEAGEAEAWVSGKPLAWIHQLDGAPHEELEFGGDRDLAHSIVDALGRTAIEPQ